MSIKYKHKQTGAIAEKASGTDIYNIDRHSGIFHLHKDYIENTKDWELIPEPKAEMIEVHFDPKQMDGTIFTNILSCSNKNCINSLLITNPTDKQIKMIKEYIK